MDISTPDKPKVSLLLLAYNQEKFIEEALHSVLAIDYENIEIIVSDDASTDNTYSIIERTLSRYDGDKKIIKLKSEWNLGIGKHISKLLAFTSGDLIFFSAGDDVSYKRRVSAVVDAWIKHDRKPDAICSSADLIDEDGNGIGSIKASQIKNSLRDELKYFFGGFVGCTEVISSRMVSTFNGFDEDTTGGDKVFSEDRVFAFRAFLMGGLICINESLVGYRVSGLSVSNNITLANSCAYEDRLAYRKIELIRLASVLRQYEIDVGIYCSRLSIEEGKFRYLQGILKERRSVLRWQSIATESSIFKRMIALGFLSVYFSFGAKKFLKFIPSMFAPSKFLVRFP